MIAIGADVRRETGNDVFKTDPQLNEWMQRVRKLGGGSADVDDDERSKRLEEVLTTQQTIHIDNQQFRLTMVRKLLRRGKLDRNGEQVYSIQCGIRD